MAESCKCRVILIRELITFFCPEGDSLNVEDLEKEIEEEIREQVTDSPRDKSASGDKESEKEIEPPGMLEDIEGIYSTVIYTIKSSICAE